VSPPNQRQMAASFVAFSGSLKLLELLMTAGYPWNMMSPPSAAGTRASAGWVYRNFQMRDMTASCGVPALRATDRQHLPMMRERRSPLWAAAHPRCQGVALQA
jgi:hypothetical protein